MAVDALNAMAVEQADLKHGLEERRARVDEALTGFTTSAGGVSTALTQAAEAVETTAAETLNASDRARTEVDRADRASRDSADRVTATADATETLSRSIADIGEQVQKSLNITQQASMDVAEMARTMRELAGAVEGWGRWSA